MNRKLPAYPLFVKDPMFSVWSNTDNPTDSQTVFWTGLVNKSMTGIIRAGEESFCFLGIMDGVTPLKPVSSEITLFETVYRYQTVKFDLKVSFISPLPLKDLDILSNPSCYMAYTVEPKINSGDITVALIAHENNVYQVKDDIKGGVVKLKNIEAAFFGRKRQLYLSNSSDKISADWGYMYLSGSSAYHTSESGIAKFISSGTLPEGFEENQDRYLMAVESFCASKGRAEGKLVVTYDDVMSIFYFGEVLRGYYFRGGKTVMDAIAEAHSGYDNTLGVLAAQELEVRQAAKAYGEDYLHVLIASYRQSVAAHKLVADSRGNILFLSKECDSNGCIATVDVSYPSTPLYLLYNPELVEGMLRPVFRFAKMDAWEFDFAPHDAGTYPFCLGQTYGMSEIKDRYTGDRTQNFRDDGSNHPMFYTFPAGNSLYDFNYQMPVEECGNMLIMSSALVLLCGRKDLASENIDLLRRWADYLAEKGAVPENQLCTDDFAGHLDKNINLSIKAAVALAAFAKTEQVLGNQQNAQKYRAFAEEFTQFITSKYKDKSHTPLTFDSGQETFSLKYNLAFDRVLNLNLFSADFYEREADKYLKQANTFGVPLDSRQTYTKSDWVLWAASLTDDIVKAQKLIKPVSDCLTESNSRVPFSDWYDTVTGKFVHFMNRTVQGGTFMPLLKDKARTSIK